MKSLKFRVCSFVLAMLMMMSAAACNSGEKPETSGGVQTNDNPLQETVVESEEPDIGEHKDYDKERAKCYYSNEILMVEQENAKRGMEIFSNNTTLCEFYGNEINTMKDKLGKKINMYSMIIPTACQFYCPSNMRRHITDAEEIQAYVRDMLVNIKEVNILPTLSNHNAENIYFKTDTRWTALGAYYAAKVFAKTAGVDFADISEYNKREISSEFVGNLKLFTDGVGTNDLNENPDKFVYYEPKIDFKTHFYDEEFEYLGEGKFFEEVPENLNESYYKGGYYCLKLSSNVKTSRKLLIVKDTMATNMAPFLTSSFSDVYVVDVDYLEANLVELIEEFCITDVLYALNTFSVSGSGVYSLETLRTQATHGSLKDEAPEYEPPVEEESEIVDDNSADTDTDSDGVDYVYDVGVNNPIGVMINSQFVDIDEYYNNIDKYTKGDDEEEEDFGDDLGEDENNEDNEYYENYE